jgi:hypothetical protein
MRCRTTKTVMNRTRQFCDSKEDVEVPNPQSIVVVVVVIIIVVVVVVSYFPAPFDVNRFPGERVPNCCEVY